jgi:hypothetical protein
MPAPLHESSVGPLKENADSQRGKARLTMQNLGVRPVKLDQVETTLEFTERSGGP